MVRIADNGVDLIFVGRRDQMVKSRGYRIEPGEIEAVLHAAPGVKEAVVVTEPDPLIGSRIKAFVVPLAGEQLAARQLQAHCARLLPRHMVPESVEVVAELPKTSSGKVDRRSMTHV